MATTRSCIALTVHGIGWAALLAAILLARVGALPEGSVTTVVLAVGLALFVACAVWSAVQLVDRLRVVEATSRRRVIRSGPSTSERFSRFPLEPQRPEFSRQASHGFGAARIRRHEVASGSASRSS